MDKKQNVLILGSGGREHTLAWKISQSQLLNKLYIAPGNGGTETVAATVSLNVNDFEQISHFCIDKKIDIVIVGPEDPLVNGISDYFANNTQLAHIFVFGPNKLAAQLEGSKDFSKQFMIRNNIPTAAYKTFTIGEEQAACAFLKTLSPPYVLKADGLAAGKGVLILNSLAEAEKSVSKMLNGQFGKASEKLVIEEFLDGIEVSFFTLNDGKYYILLPEAKDYKRIGEGDTGLNTGGMGAVSPVHFVDEVFKNKVIHEIIEPTNKGLAKDGIDYFGFLFFGLINVGGQPKVIEYNCRMGDPETEVVIPRLKSDLLAAILLAKHQKLNEYQTEISTFTASAVITVSNGYPEQYKKGLDIALPDTENKNQVLFHAGTIKNDTLKTNGGRVFACTGMGNNIQEALNNSYQLATQINYEGKFFRRDIGKDLMNQSNNE